FLEDLPGDIANEPREGDEEEFTFVHLSRNRVATPERQSPKNCRKRAPGKYYRMVKKSGSPQLRENRYRVVLWNRRCTRKTAGWDYNVRPLVGARAIVARAERWGMMKAATLRGWSTRVLATAMSASLLNAGNAWAVPAAGGDGESAADAK